MLMSNQLSHQRFGDRLGSHLEVFDFPFFVIFASRLSSILNLTHFVMS